MSDWIYALDIGTRKVAGVVGLRTAQGAQVIAVEVMEHSERSMLDGQVHDVAAVAAVVRAVTRVLEQRVGEPLREVSVAAAGRALHTSRGTATVELVPGRPVGSEELQHLERRALENALPGAREGFHCVGFTPIAYRLDDVEVRSPVDLKGHQLEADVLATFLPQSVLDGLLAVCERAGLQPNCHRTCAC
jgi:cell division ATPase FtsA